MAVKTGTGQNCIAKRWIVLLGIFLLVQLGLIALDNISFAPNLNDSGSLLARTGRSILQSQLFTESITPYSYSPFNLVFALHAAALFLQAVKDIITSIVLNKG